MANQLQVLILSSATLYICIPVVIRSFVGSDVMCFSGRSKRHFSGPPLCVLFNDVGVDCDPSVNDDVLDDNSPRFVGGYLISSGGCLDIRKLAVVRPVVVIPLLMDTLAG